jgi:hypothetical protein
MRGKLESQIQDSTKIGDEQKSMMHKVLQTGRLPAEEPQKSKPPANLAGLQS